MGGLTKIPDPDSEQNSTVNPRSKPTKLRSKDLNSKPIALLVAGLAGCQNTTPRPVAKDPKTEGRIIQKENP